MILLNSVSFYHLQYTKIHLGSSALLCLCLVVCLSRCISSLCSSDKCPVEQGSSREKLFQSLSRCDTFWAGTSPALRGKLNTTRYRGKKMYILLSEPHKVSALPFPFLWYTRTLTFLRKSPVDGNGLSLPIHHASLL